jgi:hypothetical protein
MLILASSQNLAERTPSPRPSATASRVVPFVNPLQAFVKDVVSSGQTTSLAVTGVRYVRLL